MKCWLAQGSSVRRSTFSPLDSFSPYKRDLREMTDSNRLTDFIARLFMKIDNRINRGFLFVCFFFFLLLLFSVFQISRIHFTQCFFLLRTQRFIKVSNLSMKGGHFFRLDQRGAVNILNSF